MRKILFLLISFTTVHADGIGGFVNATSSYQFFDLGLEGNDNTPALQAELNYTKNNCTGFVWGSKTVGDKRGNELDIGGSCTFGAASMGIAYYDVGDVFTWDGNDIVALSGSYDISEHFSINAKHYHVISDKFNDGFHVAVKYADVMPLLDNTNWLLQYSTGDEPFSGDDGKNFQTVSGSISYDLQDNWSLAADVAHQFEGSNKGDAVFALALKKSFQ